MDDPQQPYPQPKRDHELPNTRGIVIRLPRPFAIFVLALLIICFLALGFVLATSFSELSPFYFFGGLLSLATLGVVIFFVVVVRRRKAISYWAPTPATVVESEAVWGTSSSGGRTARTWLPRFTYQYEIGGQVYRGKRIAFYRRCTGSRAQELVARHPIGSKLQVYYNPAHPAEAVMERNFRALWVSPFFAIVYGALAFVFFKLPALLDK